MGLRIPREIPWKKLDWKASGSLAILFVFCGQCSSSFGEQVMDSMDSVLSSGPFRKDERSQVELRRVVMLWGSWAKEFFIGQCPGCLTGYWMEGEFEPLPVPA